MALLFYAGACGDEEEESGAVTDVTTMETATVEDEVFITKVTRVSTDSAGAQADGPSGGLSIAGEGGQVAFASSAANLVEGDTNGVDDIFVKDLASGMTTRVSTDSADGQADGPSGTSTISGVGRHVAFWSEATNLTASDTNGLSDIFVKDRDSGTTSLVSTDAGGDPGDGASDMPSISDDGRYVAFRSAAANLVPGDTNSALDVFVKDTATGETKIVSADASAVPGDADSCDTYPPSISADGRYVAFESAASNLVTGDANGVRDIFVKDTQTGAIARVSTSSDGARADGSSLYATISDDGGLVLFRSIASNLVAGDTVICEGVNCSDVFLKDVVTGALIRVSTSEEGTAADAPSWDPALAGGGGYAAFSTTATNLAGGDGNGDYDIYVKEIGSGVVFLASKGTGGQAGNGWSISPYLSADGRYVAFQSVANDLVVGDTNGFPDVFVGPARP